MGLNFDWGLLTVLMMFVGGDIVHRAFANIANHDELVAVPFSFGWVAYAWKSITQSRLLPLPELPGFVINAANGYVRPNYSWVISRFLHGHSAGKDWEKKGHAMAISVLKTKKDDPKPGDPVFRGSTIVAFQLYLAFIPALAHGNSQPLLALLACISLVMFYNGVWKGSDEKHAARTIKPGNTKTVILTPGNGWRHAIVVISDGTGFNLEDLASGQVPNNHFKWGMQCALPLGWMCMLFAIQRAGGYMFLAALLGTCYNLYIASSNSTSGLLGTDVEHLADIIPDEGDNNVMSVIKKLEEYEDKDAGLDRSQSSPLDGAGTVMIPTFFPGEIPNKDMEWVARRKQRNANLRKLGEDEDSKEESKDDKVEEAEMTKEEKSEEWANEQVIVDEETISA